MRSANLRNEYWYIKENFFNNLHAHVEQYSMEMEYIFSKSEAKKYIKIANAFFYYLHDYTDHKGFETITLEDTNSKFIAMLRKDTFLLIDNKEITSKLRVFIEYLNKKGFKNPNLLISSASHFYQFQTLQLKHNN